MNEQYQKSLTKLELDKVLALLADHAAAERLNSPIQLLGMIRKQHGLPPSALVFLRENPDKTSCPPASQPASRACAAAHC